MTQESRAGEVSNADSSKGWLVVAATFLSTFTVFGVAYSFGAFFRPMADEFGRSRGETALFFSITTFLYFLLGAFTGRISDRVGPRRVVLTGAAVMVVGLLLTSMVDQLWLGYITYGIGVGVGVACAYVPMVATVGLWFERQRTAALGVAVAGIGVGTLVVAPVAELIIDRIGWRDTYVVFAVATGALLTLASLGAKRPPDVETDTDLASLRSLIEGSSAFVVLYVSMTLLSAVLFVPFVFLDDYLDVTGIEGSGALLVGVIGISSVFGRLTLGALASVVSSMALYKFSFLGIALSHLLWITADDSYRMLLVFAGVLGVAYGGFIALAPAVTAELFGSTGLGTTLGALYTAAAVGGLVGPPLAGLMLDRVGYGTTLWLAMAVGTLSWLSLISLKVPAVN